jgi:general secretion pathway protein G
MAATQEKRSPEHGFTLLELIIVIAIIGILAAIAMPALKDAPRRAAEAALKTDLRTLRDVIDQYYGDKGFYPETLQALTDAHYLRGIPIDPLTKSSETWEVVMEDSTADSMSSGLPADASAGDPTGDQKPGVVDVHSGSPLMALDGKTYYKDW